MKFFGWLLRACAACRTVAPFGLQDDKRCPACRSQDLAMFLQEATAKQKAHAEERQVWRCPRCKEVYKCNGMEADEHQVNHNRLILRPDPIALLQVLDPHELAPGSRIALP